MTEVLFRVPSRTVKYGYVDVNVEGDFGSSPEMLATHYVNYVYAFQKEEEAAVARLLDASSGALKAPLAASQDEVDQVIQETVKKAQALADGRKEARQIIEKELGPVTELTEEQAADELVREGQEIDAPWKQEVATPKKPWETDAKPVVTEDW